MKPLDSRLRGNDIKTQEKDKNPGSRLAPCFAGLGRDDDPAYLKRLFGLCFGQGSPVKADNPGDGLDKGLSQAIGV